MSSTENHFTIGSITLYALRFTLSSFRSFIFSLLPSTVFLHRMEPAEIDKAYRAGAERRVSITVCTRCD